ncbi:hypothetical protein [Metabacillus idriensis]|uniref:hypothetical protein n=1 Tax=Metabacillus idriensis TaxID=324768 RepID=UPI0017489728|nr:hypothetical protein [Metabacillus idriensis]
MLKWLRAKQCTVAVFDYRGIFHAIKDFECYNCKIVHLDNKNNKKSLIDMLLLNGNSALYESVKGMYEEEFGDAIMDIGINHVYLKKIA